MFNRYERKQISKLKLIKLSSIKHAPAYYDKDKNRCVRYWYSKRTKWLKRNSNKVIRKSNDIPSGKSQYKKLFEYKGALI